MLRVDQVEELFRRLGSRMPRASGQPGAKEHPKVFRALVGCLLSAQSRDENTTEATAALFRLADDPAGILALADESIAAAIRPAGLYNIKTKRLKALCRALIEEHDGIVPSNRSGLMRLPGIGRKCADIMLLFSFDKATIAVDTHVHRVCNRTGLATGRTEAQTAVDLERRAPEWAKRHGHVRLLAFGKTVCRARAPRCTDCFLSDICESAPTPVA
jgi:endonuclease-3